MIGGVDSLQILADVDQFMNQGRDVVLAAQGRFDLHQVLAVILLLPTHNALTLQAAMVNGDRCGSQERLLVQHESVDLLSEAGALAVTRGENHRVAVVVAIVGPTRRTGDRWRDGSPTGP